MHTFKECQVKIEAIKILLERIRISSEMGYDLSHLLDSTGSLCEELLREDMSGKEERVR